MSRQNHDELCYDWNVISGEIRTVNGTLNDMWIDLVIKASECKNDTGEQLALLELTKRLKAACDQLDGMAYMCTPQSEWLGGDRSALRVPHIVNEANKLKS